MGAFLLLFSSPSLPLLPHTLPLLPTLLCPTPSPPSLWFIFRCWRLSVTTMTRSH